MDRQTLIGNTIKKINRLPDYKLKEVDDFVEFLLSKIEDNILQEGIQKMSSESETFEFLNDEEEIYSVNDVKERFK